MKIKDTYTVLGLMSGTSLDGLDLACCTFRKVNDQWEYSIDKATTQSYSSTWTKNLMQAHLLDGQDLVALDAAYGKFLGNASHAFLKKHNLAVDFIASHGHTIFHQPALGFTFQLGNGTALNVASGKPVICDFRSLDVALEGEGAPLVPAGDKFLFSEYDVCLNLGGIANLSMDVKGARVAFDICFVNMGLNYLASKAGKKFDAGGSMSSKGKVDQGLLMALNKIYLGLKKKRPSLGREIFEKSIKPLLDSKKIDLKDKLHTFSVSAAKEIASVILSQKQNEKVLITGGGALNSFFVSQLLDACEDKAALIIPDESIVKFKEAMVFAFLGVLRTRNEVNCLKSVTGATRDCSGGVLVGF